MATATEATETKAEAFRRLGSKRVNRALGDIALIGNLGASQYEKSEEQVDAIEAALLDAVRSTMARLRHVKQDRPTFSF